MAEEIEVGMIVRLMCGPPDMTVTDVKEGVHATCVWVSTDDGELHSGEFPLLALRVIKPYCQ